MRGCLLLENNLWMEKKRKEGALDEKRETELLTQVFLRPGGHGCPRAWGRRSGVHGGSSPASRVTWVPLKGLSGTRLGLLHT